MILTILQNGPFPDVQEDEDESVEVDKDNAGREDTIVDVVTPADIPTFYSRQALCVTVDNNMAHQSYEF